MNYYFRLLIALFLLTSSAISAQSAKLAPAEKAQSMWGDVSVLANAKDERCVVVLFEDKVAQGYRFENGEKCSKAFAVMAKIKAWRVYTDGRISFVDDQGHDLVMFHGKGYKRSAIKKVDGIWQIWSAQEVAE